jgi:hypothetical protein
MKFNEIARVRFFLLRSNFETLVPRPRKLKNTTGTQRPKSDRALLLLRPRNQNRRRRGATEGRPGALCERSEKSRLVARNRDEALCAWKRIMRPVGKRTEGSVRNQIEARAGARAPGAETGSSESLRAQADLGSSQNRTAHSRENRRKHHAENRS